MDTHTAIQHSPLPWSFASINGDNYIMAKIGNSRVVVAEAVYDEANGEGISLEELDANKAFIVNACNNAERLAEALESVTSDIRNRKGSSNPITYGTLRNISEALAGWKAAQ